MTEKEQGRAPGVVMMFIGGVLTIFGGVLLGNIQIFSSLVTVPSDEVAILQLVLFFGLILDLLGICFYSSSFYLKDKKTDKPHVVSKGE
jgi:hypothetical protein